MLIVEHWHFSQHTTTSIFTNVLKNVNAIKTEVSTSLLSLNAFWKINKIKNLIF